ncbi:MAG: hypothetical protein M0Z95_27425 [Actinomycetota bacterium]|jgi:hypothetical protein|nr:hypothetical protein [Actinomycetota bacterium]
MRWTKKPWAAWVLIAVLLVAGGTAEGLLLSRSTTPFPSGTPAGDGFLCTASTGAIHTKLFVSWDASSGRITGTAWLDSTAYASFTGVQHGTAITIDVASTGLSLTGQISGDTMTVTRARTHRSLHCTLTARPSWTDRATQVPQATADVTPTQSDLTDAAVELEALFTENSAFPTSTGTSSNPATGSTLQGQLGALGPPTKFLPASAPAPAGTDALSAEALNAHVALLAGLDPGGGCWVAVANMSTGVTPLTDAPSGISFGWVTARNPANCSARLAGSEIGAAPDWRPKFKTLGPRA